MGLTISHVCQNKRVFYQFLYNGCVLCFCLKKGEVTVSSTNPGLLCTARGTGKWSCQTPPHITQIMVWFQMMLCFQSYSLYMTCLYYHSTETTYLHFFTLHFIKQMENYKHNGYLSFRKKINTTVIQNVPLIDLMHWYPNMPFNCVHPPKIPHNLHILNPTLLQQNPHQ